MPFDVAAAKQSGYSDDEILSHLTESRKFDIGGARQAGYSNQEIIDHLSSAPVKSAPSNFQRVSGAIAEANPLSARQLPEPGQEPTPGSVLEEAKNMFIPGEGHFGAGHPLNLVHAIPVIGPGIAKALSEMNPKEWPEALGHMIGMGASGAPGEPAAGPGIQPGQIEVAPVLAKGAKAVAGAAKAVGKVVLSPETLPTASEALTAAVSRHGAAAHYASRQLGRIMEAIKSDPKAPPDAEAEIRSALEQLEQPKAEQRPTPPSTSPAAPANPYASRFPEVQRQVTAAAEPAAETAGPAITPPRGEPGAPANPYRSRFPEVQRSAAPVEPANTITSPETAEPGPQISAREATNRTALAHEMADFLHAKGHGISYTDALRMGPDQWQMARSAVRQGGKASRPSPATVQLALEHLKQIEEKAGSPPPVKDTSPPTPTNPRLTGKSLDIAQQLEEAMQ